ncbi:MAG: hypothetical protein ACPHUL_00110 [Marinomonas gallaica]
MSADKDTAQLYSMVEKLDRRQDETNSEIRGLTEKIGDLVTVLARNETANEYMAKRVDDCENRLTNHGERIAECEKAQVGTLAERKLWDWVLKAAVTIVVGVVLYGAFKDYV